MASRSLRCAGRGYPGSLWTAFARLWGPGEQSLAEEVTRASNGAAELAPATSITDLFAIARRARADFRGYRTTAHRWRRRDSTGGAVRSDAGESQRSMVGGGRRDLAHRLVFVSVRRRCRRNAACIDDIQLAGGARRGRAAPGDATRRVMTDRVIAFLVRRRVTLGFLAAAAARWPGRRG